MSWLRFNALFEPTWVREIFQARHKYGFSQQPFHRQHLVIVVFKNRYLGAGQDRANKPFLQFWFVWYVYYC